MDSQPKSVYELLQEKFKPGEYAILPEVRNAAGFQASRSADFVMLGLWPSRGMELHGVEVKASRSDWLRELKNPVKAEAVYRFCDRWWLLATNEDVCKKEEVPKTWGLMVVRNNRIKFEIAAPSLTPQPIERSFMVAMLKRASEGMIPRNTIQKEIQAAREEGRKSAQHSIEYAERETRDLKTMLKAFEEASGVRINKWEPKEIGSAVKLVLNGGVDNIRHELQGLQQKSTEINETIKRVLEEKK